MFPVSVLVELTSIIRRRVYSSKSKAISVLWPFPYLFVLWLFFIDSSVSLELVVSSTTALLLAFFPNFNFCSFVAIATSALEVIFSLLHDSGENAYVCAVTLTILPVFLLKVFSSFEHRALSPSLSDKRSRIEFVLEVGLLEFHIGVLL